MSTSSTAELTPLMRQYREIKQAYADAILFFRVGDFYEMFYQDAEEASRLLSIALTSRDKASPDPVPLCGVPYHAATNYIAKLLKAGRTVALCDQVEDPKTAKGLVRREVTRLYTPGTLLDTELLPPTESAWLAAVSASRASTGGGGAQAVGLAAVDLSTGDFRVSEFEGTAAAAQLQDELARIEPKELLIAPELPAPLLNSLRILRGCRFSTKEEAHFEAIAGQERLRKHFAAAELEKLRLLPATAGRTAAAAILRYLQDTQPNADLRHVRELRVQAYADDMRLDSMTIRNLELVRPLHEVLEDPPSAVTTLFGVLDHTVTVMGSRLLREWILRPLVQRAPIEARQDAVGELHQNLEVRVHLRTALKTVQDIARLSSRIAVGRASPRDLLALQQSLSALPAMRTPLARLRAPLLTSLADAWDDAADVHDSIARTIAPEAPATIRDGGVIREGYHPEVDALRAAMRDGQQWLVQLETKERGRTGIDSLKVRYNQVFGYYLEVTKTNLAKVPADYIRKQTLANAERFMTPELKELEERITGAEGKLKAQEAQLFEQFLLELSAHTARFQAIAGRLATLDVLMALAEVAARSRYIRPTMTEDGLIEIVGGRHPVVEQLALETGFIPNDTHLDQDQHRLHILTGPNMAGKSTYLRQVALIVLMAQMGSFVPASGARIGIVDRVFTRVGASDNLAAGQSTFMVEMSETAHILQHATSKSLILLDEIGRGTSTYDGLSIAWALAEFIQSPDRLGARTLFATHYHEMTQLADLRPGIKNYRVAVQERDGDVLFLRKIVEGGADRSYGIHVAKLAGIPRPVLSRAQEVLHQLEQSTQSNVSPGAGENHQASLFDPSLPPPHPILDEVRQMDLFSMTPLEALNRLAELKRRLDQDN